MNHQQHHEHHVKEREHEKRGWKERIHELTGKRQGIHPAWYIIVGVLLVGAAVFVWTFFIW